MNVITQEKSDYDDLTDVEKKCDFLLSMKSLFETTKRHNVTVFEMCYVLLGIDSNCDTKAFDKKYADDWIASLQRIVKDTGEEINDDLIKLVQKQLAVLLGTEEYKMLITQKSISKFIAYIKKATQKGDDSYEAVVSYLELYSTILMFMDKLNLNEKEIRNLVRFPDFGGDLKFSIFEKVAELFSWNKIYATQDTDLTDYLILSKGDLNTKKQVLSKATGWRQSDITSMYNALPTSTMNEISILLQMKKIIELSKIFNHSVDSILEICNWLTQYSRSNNPVDARDFDLYYDSVDNLEKSIRKKVASTYDENNWKTINKKLAKNIQKKKRDSLYNWVVSHLSSETGKKITSFDLYDYFLIDIEVSDDIETSRVKEAISAAELYLQRVKLNLENHVKKHTIPDTWWSWIGNYRLWQAKQEIFLYPENYLNPTLRNNQSSAFQKFSNQLLQGELSKTNIHEAFSQYTDQLSDILGLVSVGSYYYRDEIKGKSTIYFVARTQNKPYDYYYCEYSYYDGQGNYKDGGLWSSWKKIDVPINADKVTPCFAFGKLFVFWVEISKVQSSDFISKKGTSGEGENSQKVLDIDAPKFDEHKATVKCSYKKEDGSWLQPQIVLNNKTVGLKRHKGTSKNNMQADSGLKGFFEFDEDVWNTVSVKRVKAEGKGVSHLRLESLHTPSFLSRDKKYLGALTDINKVMTELKKFGYVTDMNTVGDNFHSSGQFDEKFLLNLRKIFSLWTKEGFDIYVAELREALIEQKNKMLFEKGAENDERLVITFGPYLYDIDCTKTDSPFQEEDTQIENIYEMELYDRISEYCDRKSASGKTMVPLIPAIILDDNLDKASLSSTSEIVVFEDSILADSAYLPTLEVDKAKRTLSIFYVDNAMHQKHVVKREYQSKDMKKRQIILNNVDPNATFFPVENYPGLFVVRSGKEQFLIVLDYEKFESYSSLAYVGNPKVSYDWSALGAKKEKLEEKGVIDAFGYYNSGDTWLKVSWKYVSKELKDQGVTKHFDTDMAWIFNASSVTEKTFQTSTVSKEDSKKIFNMLINDGTIINSVMHKVSREHLVEKGLSAFASCDFSGISHISKEFIYNKLLEIPVRKCISYWQKGLSADELSTAHEKVKIIRISNSSFNQLKQKTDVGNIASLLGLEGQQAPVQSFLPFSRFEVNEDSHTPAVKDGYQVDFTGPYGQYSWEIFFHAPLLVAWQLSAQKRFEEAIHWLHFVFNPTQGEKFVTEDTFFEKASSLFTKNKSVTIFEKLKTMTGILSQADATILNEKGEVSSTYTGDEDIKNNIGIKLSDKEEEAIHNILSHFALSSSNAHNWNFQPFRNLRLKDLSQILSNANPNIAVSDNNPFDPYVIARNRIGAFEKFVLLEYVKILTKWGDALFMQNTRTSINQAVLRYVYAYDLLGARPKKVGNTPQKMPKTIKEILAQYKSGSDIPKFLTEFERFAALEYQELKDKTSETVEEAFNSFPTYFSIPENERMMKAWDTLDDRLYKIRNSLDIKGHKDILPLFASPIDPNQLVRAVNSGSSLARVTQFTSRDIPPYRFSMMSNLAHQCVQSTIHFAEVLESALEKKDAEHLLALQESNLVKLTDLHQNVLNDKIKAVKSYITGLEHALDGANTQKKSYDSLISNGVSAKEKSSEAAAATAITLNTLAGTLGGVASIAFAVPQVGSPFAMTFGGVQLGNVAMATTALTSIGLVLVMLFQEP